MDQSVLRDDDSENIPGHRSGISSPIPQQRNVELRNPSTLQLLAMEAISQNRDFYENKYQFFGGFKLLSPPVLQMLIEHIDMQKDRFLTPDFAKMLLNQNTHYANIGAVDERYRQKMYDCVISNCCNQRLKIIRSLWVDCNLKVSLSDLLKFRSLQSLEILQLECTEEILHKICFHFPQLRSLAVTFREEYISEDGIGCLGRLEFLESFSYKVDKEDASYYKRMLDDLNSELNLNLQIKPFAVSGLKRRVITSGEVPARKPVAERIGSYLKKKLVRAFSRGEMDC